MSDARFAFKLSSSKLLLLVALLGFLVVGIETAHAQTYNVLYSFCSQRNCADGYYPTAPLVQDKSGDLFGTTLVGGAGPCTYPNGCGTLFELSDTGTYTVLHSFTGSPDGQFPAGLVFDQQGNLYGTTQFGGSNDYGAVYEVPSSETVHVLYSFSGGVDGNGGKRNPVAGRFLK